MSVSIAVFGGTGFIGARVCKQLVEMGEKVVCIDLNPRAERLAGLEDNLTLIKADIREAEQIFDIICKYKVKRIIDFAYMLDAESNQWPHTALKVNVVGTNSVFEVARIAGIKRVIWASSIAVYGPKEDSEKPLVETDICQPVTVYGACKQVGEFMSQFYNQEYGMEIACIRPSAVFGPGRLSGLSSWISDIVTLPALGKEVVIPARPEKRFTFTYVDDMASDFIALAFAPRLEHTIYNARGYMKSLMDVAEVVRKYIPEAVIKFTGADVYYASWLDGTRLEQAVGKPLKFTFEGGIKEQIERVRKFGALG